MVDPDDTPPLHLADPTQAPHRHDLHDDCRPLWSASKPDGAELVDRVRGIFAELIELDKVAPGEVDRVVTAIVNHLRSWRPVSVAPLGTLPPPTEAIRDPRARPDSP